MFPGMPGYATIRCSCRTPPRRSAPTSCRTLKVGGLTVGHYKNGGRRTDDFTGTWRRHLLQAYVGDPMKIHVLSSPGSEQPTSFRAGGLAGCVMRPRWVRKRSPSRAWSISRDRRALIGGAGGRFATGDFFYGDNRRPFPRRMWGILRVLRSRSAPPLRPIRLLDGRLARSSSECSAYRRPSTGGRHLVQWRGLVVRFAFILAPRPARRWRFPSPGRSILNPQDPKTLDQSQNVRRRDLE